MASCSCIYIYIYNHMYVCICMYTYIYIYICQDGGAVSFVDFTKLLFTLYYLRSHSIEWEVFQNTSS